MPRALLARQLQSTCRVHRVGGGAHRAHLHPGFSQENNSRAGAQGWAEASGVRPGVCYRAGVPGPRRTYGQITTRLLPSQGRKMLKDDVIWRRHLPSPLNVMAQGCVSQWCPHPHEEFQLSQGGRRRNKNVASPGDNCRPGAVAPRRVWRKRHLTWTLAGMKCRHAERQQGSKEGWMALRQEAQEHALHSFINSFVYSLIHSTFQWLPISRPCPGHRGLRHKSHLGPGLPPVRKTNYERQ